MGQQLVAHLSQPFKGEFPLHHLSCRMPQSYTSSRETVRIVVRGVIDLSTRPGSSECGHLTFPETLQIAERLVACDLQKKAIYSFQQTVRVLHLSIKGPLGYKILKMVLQCRTSGLS